MTEEAPKPVEAQPNELPEHVKEMEAGNEKLLSQLEQVQQTLVNMQKQFEQLQAQTSVRVEIVQREKSLLSLPQALYKKARIVIEGKRASVFDFTQAGSDKASVEQAEKIIAQAEERKEQEQSDRAQELPHDTVASIDTSFNEIEKRKQEEKKLQDEQARQRKEDSDRRHEEQEKLRREAVNRQLSLQQQRALDELIASRKASMADFVDEHGRPLPPNRLNQKMDMIWEKARQEAQSAPGTNLRKYDSGYQPGRITPPIEPSGYRPAPMARDESGLLHSVLNEAERERLTQAKEQERTPTNDVINSVTILDSQTLSNENRADLAAMRTALEKEFGQDDPRVGQTIAEVRNQMFDGTYNPDNLRHEGTLRPVNEIYEQTNIDRIRHKKEPLTPEEKEVLKKQAEKERQQALNTFCDGLNDENTDNDTTGEDVRNAIARGDMTLGSFGGRTGHEARAYWQNTLRPEINEKRKREKEEREASHSPTRLTNEHDENQYRDYLQRYTAADLGLREDQMGDRRLVMDRAGVMDQRDRRFTRQTQFRQPVWNEAREEDRRRNEQARNNPNTEANDHNENDNKQERQNGTGNSVRVSRSKRNILNLFNPFGRR